MESTPNADALNSLYFGPGSGVYVDGVGEVEQARNWWLFEYDNTQPISKDTGCLGGATAIMKDEVRVNLGPWGAECFSVKNLDIQSVAAVGASYVPAAPQSMCPRPNDAKRLTSYQERAIKHIIDQLKTGAPFGFTLVDVTMGAGKTARSLGR